MFFSDIFKYVKSSKRPISATKIKPEEFCNTKCNKNKTKVDNIMVKRLIDVFSRVTRKAEIKRKNISDNEAIFSLKNMPAVIKNRRHIKIALLIGFFKSMLITIKSLRCHFLHKESQANIYDKL